MTIVWPETQQRRQCSRPARARSDLPHALTPIAIDHGYDGIAGAEVDTDGERLHEAGSQNGGRARYSSAWEPSTETADSGFHTEGTENTEIGRI